MLWAQQRNILKLLMPVLQFCKFQSSSKLKLSLQHAIFKVQTKSNLRPYFNDNNNCKLLLVWFILNNILLMSLLVYLVVHIFKKLYFLKKDWKIVLPQFVGFDLWSSHEVSASMLASKTNPNSIAVHNFDLSLYLKKKQWLPVSCVKTKNMMIILHLISFRNLWGEENTR